MAYAGYGNLRPLRHFGHTPALYAYRGLSASGFALPWRTALAERPGSLAEIDWPLSLHSGPSGSTRQ